MTEGTSRCAAVAEALRVAEATAAPIPPPTASWAALGIRDAYEIQRLNVQRRLDDGARVRGFKVGLTSTAMQQMLGVSEPDYGHLLDDMVHESGALVDAGRYCTPRVEPEVAFVLARPLRGPDCRPEDVLDATASVHPALEIIDSRVADWRITLADTIADNASSAGVVLQGAGVPVDAFDLAAIDVTLTKNGAAVATGATSAVLGHPAAAVAWLVNTLDALGVHPDAGHVVLPGSCTKAIDIAAGDQVRAEFVGLGSVDITFTASGGSK